MIDLSQSLAMERAMPSITASIRERGAPVEANTSQPEKVFVPFHLPPAKPRTTAEGQPPVAVPASETMPVAV